MPRLPPVIDAAVLPDAVLRAAVLDGELVAIGDAYLPIDLPVDPAARARSLRSIAVSGRVLADRTAAWVWGVVPDLTVPRCTIVPSTASVAHSPSAPAPGVHTRSARLPRADIAEPGGIPVTSPLRTALDLACGDDGDLDAITALLALAGIGPEAALADLRGRRRLRGASGAARRLQVLVTR